MTVLKLKLVDNDLDKLVNCLIRERLFDYENHSTDMSILISDNLRLADVTSLLNTVVLKRESSFILIDLISGGGHDGLFSGMVQQDYVRGAAKAIYEYAELYGLQIDPVEVE